MFEYVRGTVVGHGAGAVVIDTGGVAYRLAVSDSTLGAVPAEGEARLFTHLLVREDRQELFGFADRGERHLFRELLLVSGVGPSLALALLSAYAPAALAAHIASADLAALTRVKGVGRRTGERILVELRDRFVKATGARPTAASVLQGAQADAVLALCSLGIPRAEAERRVVVVAAPDLPLEEIVKRALRPARQP